MTEKTAPLLQRREGAVLVLSNNNTAARNALSPAFYAALTEALAAAQQDPAVGAIVLTGEGGHFCAGGDLRQLARRRELPVQVRRAKLEGIDAPAKQEIITIDYIDAEIRRLEAVLGEQDDDTSREATSRTPEVEGAQN